MYPSRVTTQQNHNLWYITSDFHARHGLSRTVSHHSKANDKRFLDFKSGDFPQNWRFPNKKGVGGFNKSGDLKTKKTGFSKESGDFQKKWRISIKLYTVS